MRIAIHMEKEHIYYFYPFSWFMRHWNWITLPKEIFHALRNDTAIINIRIEK